MGWSMSQEVSLAAHHHGYLVPPTCPHGLPITLEVPARNQPGVEAARGHKLPNRRRIAPEKVQARMPGPVIQEFRVISRQKWSIPLEAHAKIPALLLRGGSKAIENLEFQFSPRRQSPIPRGEVLD